MVLFVGELPIETEYRIWDLFFVKGGYIQSCIDHTLNDV